MVCLSSGQNMLLLIPYARKARTPLTGKEKITNNFFKAHWQRQIAKCFDYESVSNEEHWHSPISLRRRII